jgi:FMN phosphatase YigB (HAD superfamily)
MAHGAGAKSIAYTYSEPTVFFELMLETATLARTENLASIMVSNGFQSPECLDELGPVIQAANIDLKSFREEFYRDVFPTLADTARPAAGAREAVLTALGLGLRVAVATNPIFPRIAIDHRISWAGLADVEFDLVTTYEQMTACKPHPGYYRQVAEILGVMPSECLMVGDDHILDMPAADIGMRTYYVGSLPGVSADVTGDLEALADLLPRLV